MSEITQQSYLFHRSFKDIDDLTTEARHWDLDFRQLGRGQFDGEFIQYGTDEVHVVDARFGLALRQLGAPPFGMRTVAIPAHRGLRCVWRGQVVTGDDLMVFPLGGELDCVSQDEFRAFTCSFPEHLLSALCGERRLNGFSELCAGNEVLRCVSSTLENLRKRLHRISQLASQTKGVLLDAKTADWLSRDLPQRLLTVVATSLGSSIAATTRRRELGLFRAETFIEQNSGEEISVSDICRAAQVSQRTLEYAFNERFGMTCQAFLKIHRLNMIHRQLQVASPKKQTVAEIANQLGVWHMGQFASDYRRQFGQLPSTTLMKAKKRSFLGESR